jgi:hypothetical protein
VTTRFPVEFGGDAGLARMGGVVERSSCQPEGLGPELASGLDS